MSDANQEARGQADWIVQFSTELDDIRNSGKLLDRMAYARDCWPLLQIRLAGGRIGEMPDLIVWPKSTEDVARIHQFAVRHQVPVVPFGAGSGVCGGAYALKGGIMMDLKMMDEIISVDWQSLTCRVQAGKNGQLYEEELNAMGLSCGHFPSSMYCSTVGGWVAARGAGQCSTQYGKIEDMVLGATWVKPDGEIVNLSLDDGPYSVVLLELLTGSEGTLGTIAEVELRVFPLPEERRFLAFTVGNVETGIHLARQMIQGGVLPSVFRMYDPLDTLMVGGEGSQHKREGRSLGQLISQRFPGLRGQAERLFLREPGLIQRLLPQIAGKSLVILMFEGTVGKVDWQLTQVRRIARDLGAASASDDFGWAWLRNRYSVSFKQSHLYEIGSFVDTMEISATYERLPEIYHRVVAEVGRDVLIMAHFSHAYRDGASIYFTFAGYRKNAAETETLYLETWRKAIDTVMRNGGSLSHHHGIGMAKARWMDRALGGLLPVAQAIKDALDPDDLANPGKLGLV